MTILFGRTIVVVGREPCLKDQEFVVQAMHWHVQWVKDGRKPSNPGVG